MPKYVTLAEVNAYLGTSGEDTLITSLIDGVESMFDGLISSDTGLISSTKTEDFVIGDESKPPLKRNRVFDLRTYKPTSITSINGVSPGTIDVNYTLTRQRLEFKDYQTIPTVFPYRFRIVYVSGFADINAIPQEIKLAIKYLVGAFYTGKNAQGVASFKQDLLSVNYKDLSPLDTIMDDSQKSFIQNVVQSYTVFNLIS